MMTRPKLLIVDDDKEFLEEVKEMLTLSGYDIDVAADGFSALDKARKNKPDVILVDLKMSPKSGFQIADELRNAPELSNSAIIAITGFFTEKEHMMLMNMCGIKKVILKPLRPLNLIATIEFALAHKKQKEEDYIAIAN